MKLRKILKAVSKATGIKIVFLKSKKRNGEYVIARNIYFKIAIDTENFSVTNIGRKVNRTHATVLWGISTFNIDYNNDRLRTKEMYHKAINLLKNDKINKPDDINKNSLISFYNYIQKNEINHNIPQRIEKMVDNYLLESKNME